MLTLRILVEFVTIILALAGAYFIASTIGRRIDDDMLRAKAFLNKSFMKEHWVLLLLACFFFLVYATIKFYEIFGLPLDKNITDLIDQVIVLGILACSIMSQYNLSKLINK
ncbi:Uncharacterised protein [uncultured archaeon]|nr:Uncharacterised protein [uncultured archaeon]